MTKYSTVIAFLLSILFISCANNTTQFLLDDYENTESNSSVALLTVDLDILYNQFPGHNFGALRPAEKEIFDNQLATLFSRQIQSHVQGKFHQRVLEKTPFTIREFELRNRSLQILSPEPGALLENQEKYPAYVIILDQFHFTPYQIEVGGGTYAGQESQVEHRMRFETRYIIWDNERREAIAWGEVESSRILNHDDLNSTYSQVISIAFSKIVGVSPFRQNET